MTKKIKILLVLSLLISFFSCRSIKLEQVKDNYDYSKHNENKRVAVFISTILDKSISGNFEERVLIKKTFNQIIKNRLNKSLNGIAIDYYENLTINDTDIIKKKYDKNLELNFSISKDYYHTYILDILWFTPFHWGKYYFNLDLTAKSKNDSYRAAYDVTSYFSYIFFGAIRKGEQDKAFNTGIEKIIKEVIDGRGIRVITMDTEKVDDVYSNFDPNKHKLANNNSMNYDDEFSFIIKEKGMKVVQEKPYPNSRFPIAVDLRKFKGYSKVTGSSTSNDQYYKHLVASGKTWESDELEINFSTFNPVSTFYLTPSFGYFNKNFTIKDFAIDVSESNNGKDGFISGNTRDENGKEFDVSSLFYKSSFHSVYFGGEVGVNIVLGNEYVQVMFNPIFSLNLLEVRRSLVETTSLEYTDTSFALASSFSTSFQFGFFFPKIHTGIKWGWKFSYFRDFDLDRDMTFNTNVEEDGFIKIKKSYVDKVNIFSSLGFVDIIIIF